MTLKQAAARMGVTPDTLRQQIHTGALRATKHGSIWWVTEGAVRRYEEEHLGKPGRKG